MSNQESKTTSKQVARMLRSKKTRKQGVQWRKHVAVRKHQNIEEKCKDSCKNITRNHARKNGQIQLTSVSKEYMQVREEQSR